MFGMKFSWNGKIKQKLLVHLKIFQEAVPKYATIYVYIYIYFQAHSLHHKLYKFMLILETL